MKFTLGLTERQTDIKPFIQSHQTRTRILTPACSYAKSTVSVSISVSLENNIFVVIVCGKK